MPTITDFAPGLVLAFPHGRRLRVESVSRCTCGGCPNRLQRRECVAAVALVRVDTGRLLGDWHVAVTDTVPLAA